MIRHCPWAHKALQVLTISADMRDLKINKKSSSTRNPTAAWVFQNLWRIIAFGFGSGLLRPAPGTWGTLFAWLIWVVALQGLSDVTLAVGLLLAFMLGCVACDRTGRALGVSDHGGMVWDEMVAFWLVLWLVPDSLVAQAVAFVLFRLFDILKPQPIRYFDARIKGGFGVMWDDIVAAAYCLLVMAVVVTLGAFA